MPLFHLHSWRIVLLDIEFWIDSFLFQPFKGVPFFFFFLSPFFSSEMLAVIYIVFSYMYCIIFSCCFKRFYLWVSALPMVYLGVVFLYLYCLGFLSFWVCKFISFFEFGNFLPLFLQIYFCFILSSSYRRVIIYTHTHTHIYIYTHTRICTHTHICIYIRILELHYR